MFNKIAKHFLAFILYFTYISGGVNKVEIEHCEQTKYLLEVKYFRKSGDC